MRRVRVAKETVTWLESRAREGAGYLVGGQDQGDVLGACAKLADDWEADRKALHAHLPPGLVVIGVYGESLELCKAAQKALGVHLTAWMGESKLEFGPEVEVDSVDASELLNDGYAVVRCACRWIPGDDWEATAALAFPSGRVEALLGDSDLPLESLLAPAKVDDGRQGQKPAGGSKKKGGKGGGKASRGTKDDASMGPADLLRPSEVGPLLDVQLLRRRSTAPGGAAAPVVAVAAHAQAPIMPAVRTHCELLVYCPRSAPFSRLAAWVVAAMKAIRTGAQQAGGRAEGGPAELVWYHSLARQSGCTFPLRLSAVFKARVDGKELGWTRVPGQEEEEEEALMGMRRALHQRLGIPLNRPVFRSTCALALDPSKDGADEDASQRLGNVHLGLPPSGVVGGTQHVVDGSYLYYHYLQDRFDDRGWGCAYRSLQTICSFFLLNNYTSRPVPSHREIQQLLHRIGDKPAEFIDSKQWIGSMEVGFYLDSELGITWRNIFTSTGPELAEKARELAAHFDKHGTPVMMGGGNLAFTVLGVDWNQETGEVKFLILDPHYTGAEDLRAIQAKEVMMEGYRATPCGWRSPSTFAKNSFYNLCLPERPTLF